MNAILSGPHEIVLYVSLFVLFPLTFLYFNTSSVKRNPKEEDRPISSATPLEPQEKPSLESVVPVTKNACSAPELDYSTTPRDSKITRPIEGKDVAVVHPIFSPSQCKTLKQFTDSYATFWHKDASNRKFRNADTVEFHSEEVAALIFDKVKAAVPAEILISKDDEFEHLIAAGEWEIDCVPTRLLLARYLPGGHFSPHTDGNCVEDFNHRTLYSIIIYLSEPLGGETSFYEFDALQKMKEVNGIWQIEDEPQLGAITPKFGKCLIFRQTLVHEGCVIKKGVKYIIRSDIQYRRKKILYDDERGKKAWDLFQLYEEACNEGDVRLASDLYMQCQRTHPDLAKACGLI